MSACPRFRSVAPFFFLAKVPFLLFLDGRVCGLYRHAHDIPLVAQILNMCGFVGLALFFFLAKVSFLAKYKKGCGHIDMLMMFPW